MTGRPTAPATARASSIVWAMPLAGTSSPISTIAALNRSRSSAVAMASALAPMSSGRPGHADDAPLEQGHGEVEAGLPAERREDRIGPLPLDDALQHLGRQRLDVGAVGEVRIRHDRGRVGVGQDDAVALLPEDPAGLRARVVELAGLADHDGTGADDEDRLEVGPLRHQAALSDGTGSGSGRPAGSPGS